MNVLGLVERIESGSMLDWLIVGTFGVIIIGIPVFRGLAKWRGWLSDEG